MATTQAKYRLEERYRAALRALAEEYHAEGRIRRPEETWALRELIERELERRPTVAKKISGKIPRQC